MPGHKIPFQGKGVYPKSVSRAVLLSHHKNRHHVHRIFKPPTQKSRPRWFCQDPAVPPSQTPHSRIRGAASEPAPSACPHLEFVPANLRARLRLGGRGDAQHSQQQSENHPGHSSPSFIALGSLSVDMVHVPEIRGPASPQGMPGRYFSSVKSQDYARDASGGCAIRGTDRPLSTSLR